MLRVFTLYSGSSANCTAIDIDGRVILVDAGGGVRKTQKALESVGLSLSAVEAVFVTHEHSDHIAGLSTICKHFRIPIISNEATLNGILNERSDIDDSLFCNMPSGACARRDCFEVTSFRSPHDSAECVGYRIATKYGDVAVCTDAGEVTPEMRNEICGCKTVVLESNHDKNMLFTGPYPYYLKQRISGPNGHLSNEQSAEFVSLLVARGAENILLAHLSKENNTPDTAMSTMTSFLSVHGITVGKDVNINVAPPSELSHIYTYN